MLLLKRLATVLGLCVALTAVIYLAAQTVGAGIAGARAGAENGTPPTDFRAGYEVGQKAGQEFGQRYWRVMLLGACGLSSRRHCRSGGSRADGRRGDSRVWSPGRFGQ